MLSTRYPCQILIKVEFPGQIFEKYINIKFNENPFSGSRIVPRRRRERYAEADSRLSQLCEST
jgi:hypothetical protein